MSKAPEVEIVDRLSTDADLVAQIGRLYLNEWPRTIRLPATTVQLVADSNGKRMLSTYGGEMRLQFDIYTQKRTPEVRIALKKALRDLRGTVGSLRNVSCVVVNETATGSDQSGSFTWSVDATVTWEEGYE